MTPITELNMTELEAIGGGDWFEITWGVMLGAAFTAGVLGSGGFLVFGGAMGALLISGSYWF